MLLWSPPYSLPEPPNLFQSIGAEEGREGQNKTDMDIFKFGKHLIPYAKQTLEVGVFSPFHR